MGWGIRERLMRFHPDVERGVFPPVPEPRRFTPVMQRCRALAGVWEMGVPSRRDHRGRVLATGHRECAAERRIVAYGVELEEPDGGVFTGVSRERSSAGKLCAEAAALEAAGLAE